ncbi:MAG TPA: hypothetical protein PLS49_06220 [Candidatus Woesebacteria bacterium]|nr:hypothetical protein [Candidatus Woesebacteria bacterium]
MEIEEFVRVSLEQIIKAVNEVNEQASNGVYFTKKGDSRTVEFDIAVSVEDGKSKKGNVGIKVLDIGGFGIDLGKTNKNSRVSRIKFGVNIRRYVSNGVKIIKKNENA